MSASDAFSPPKPNQNIRILCYIVAYNASAFIRDVLERIPTECWNNKNYAFEVLVSDDSSMDDTFNIAYNYALHSAYAITVKRTSYNLGYGGNQKLGYDYAKTHGFDGVILLHGDGQYAPECIPSLIAPIIATEADVVLGSRMLNKKSALAGGMPKYKFFANVTLTKLQNAIAGASLTEFHTGYRVYTIQALSAIAYAKNSNGFSFDTEILLQLLDAKKNIYEVAIPTYYGKEVCHVNGLLYAWQILIATICFRLHQMGFIYDQRLSHKTIEYPNKNAFLSSHQFALRHSKKNGVIADIGGGSGHVAKALRANGHAVIGFDKFSPKDVTCYDRFIETDISIMHGLKAYGVIPDTILLLDILEHLATPERLLLAMNEELKEDTFLIVTVPNVAFITVRLRLLFGYFTYSSRGILDRGHLRFFTFLTISDLIIKSGYEIIAIEGIPAPFPLVIGCSFIARMLLKLNSALLFIHRGLFSFQIGVIAKPRPFYWRVADKE